MDWESSKLKSNKACVDLWIQSNGEWPFGSDIFFSFACRMPDPDFSVNDVKIFVGE